MKESCNYYLIRQNQSMSRISFNTQQQTVIPSSHQTFRFAGYTQGQDGFTAVITQGHAAAVYSCRGC